jgi:GntR family transcriptional regulator
MVRTFDLVRTIDRSDPLPLWAQLLTILRERLAAGDFGDGFPTDEQLTEVYGVSRHTVREAVRRLQAEGLVDRRRGVGSFVRPPAIEQPCGVLYSLYRSIEAQGHEQRSDVLDLSVVTDAEVADRLALAASSPLVRLERLRRIDGAPLAHDTVWLPHDVGAGLLDVDFTRTGLYDELARLGQPIPDAGGEWIHPLLPDAAERRLLGLPAREAVYRILRRGTSGDRPIEWRQTLMRADRYTIVARWSPTSRYEPVLAPT